MISIKQTLNTNNLYLIAGPCVIEDEQITTEIAQKLKHTADKLKIPFIFKASYSKANRSKLNSFTGPGIKKGLKILKNIKDKLDLPITTDVHSVEEIEKVKDIIDIIQIPAFLCRQTEMLIAAAKTNKYVNVKKGPFLSGESCKFIADKIRKFSENKIILTERGNSFGYENLVVDMRNIPILGMYNLSVVLDATHSNQKPNQIHGVSGGTPQYIETLACAGVAAGANGIFLETHPNPKQALSDGSTMLPLEELESLLKKLIAIKQAIN
ncbi:MAG: 3-deoxy-8-phosphooctulonate synthase [Flavobacteriales bacterium]|jgi:2-dehydro-3-deoxyphosphooctonate aldolase (KDO 8-P synthase)|nr:3-deoxy-8-phosphooctulonate synthase [Flavobacteriales bacterium]|tara:strand:+ start:143 stop:946 length:804 start_codon:yes stop_codon:yes gene_type:complete